MVGSREIPRTATFAWSPSIASSYLATGTRAGAVDADFSNETQLELWNLNLDDSTQATELQPLASVDTDSRFHDIAWSKSSDEHAQGVIAGALESGSLDLWDAEKLLNKDGDAHFSRTSNHSGPIKAVQFNPFRPELLATAGANGELFIADLNNVGQAFRMGNAVARSDDYECLDWNKKVPHILATGSNGGFVTIWDVKSRRESLTLNNYSRKPVSAIAWDPAMHVRLATAVPTDTDPLILVWDLRNSNAPERIIRGHDGGVLSLSWCAQDPDLLLSSGKDNRTIFWNPRDSTSYGELPVVTNWTFETRWNPHNPNLLAIASFDGKISVQSIQNTKAQSSQATGNKAQNTDDEDFFSKPQSQPQGPSFSLQKAPHWLERPCGASFGFGGKVVSFKVTKPTVERDKEGKVKAGEKRASVVQISTFALSTGAGTAVEDFERALKSNDLGSICKDHISKEDDEAEKNDWKIIETLTAENPRKALVDFLGFSNEEDELADGVSKLSTESKEQGVSQPNGTSKGHKKRLSTFFDQGTDGDSFLTDLAATKGGKTNNPFALYSGSRSESDRRITRALLLGQFERALDVCLQEGRLSEGFMIAICGGQACIDKAQKAFFNKKEGGADYLRLLAAVVGKNLWDVVYNADLKDWKDVMATLCTYAGADEFPDLCEALGDRLEDQMKDGESDVATRKDASFCYLAGSKLEKVVAIWVAEMEQQGTTSESQGASGDSAFSIHARLLQNLIEKVTVFRAVTDFEDKGRTATSGWKLAPLYDIYTEYADIVTSQGQLQVAERYLDLLPDKYPAAEVAKNRIRQATRKPAAQPAQRQPQATAKQQPQRPQPGALNFETQQAPAPSRPAGSSNAYAPSYGNQPQNPYAPMGNTPYGGTAGYPNQNGYQPQQMQQPRQQPGMAPPPTYGSGPGVGPPPRNINASPSVPPPSKAANMSNWNDIPEGFGKPPATSRRGTPAMGMPGPQSTYQPAPSPAFAPPSRSTPPLPPPPKAGPPRNSSPATPASQPGQATERPSSAPRNPYAPQQSQNPYAPQQSQQPMQSPNPAQRQPPIPRGASPYNAPPSAPPPSNRYAPAPSAQQAQPGPASMGSGGGQAPPPNAYAPQQNYSPQYQNSQNNPAQGASFQQPPPSAGPPQQGPPSGLPQNSRPGTAQSRDKPKPATPKHRKSSIPPVDLCTNPVAAPGDRSHIPANAQPVYEILNADFQRIKAAAPVNFKAHVNDTEKRLNYLYEHLNNKDLLKEDTIESMVELAQALQQRQYEQAQAIQVDIFTNKNDECGQWMVSSLTTIFRKLDADLITLDRG